MPTIEDMLEQINNRLRNIEIDVANIKGQITGAANKKQELQDKSSFRISIAALVVSFALAAWRILG